MLKRIVSIAILTSFVLFNKAQNWLPLALNGDLQCFFVDSIDNVLYAGGYSSAFGTFTTSNCFAKWNGTSWDSLPNKLNGNVGSIVRYKDKIYVSGNFYKNPYNCPRTTLMAWDLLNQTWQPVGTGTRYNGGEGGGAAMKIINGNLYFYGVFDSLLNAKAKCIARYDGTTCVGISLPEEQVINDIAWYKGELYACGQFTNFNGDTSMDYVIKFNGTNWVNVGANFQNAVGVGHLAVYKNELYVGGRFLKSDGCPGNHIAKFDGTTWQEVNGGFSLYNLPPAVVRDIKVFNDTMYITGSFDKMGTMPAHAVVKYDGIKFCAVDNSIWKPTASAMTVFQNRIYLAGGVTYNNGQDTVWYLAEQNKFTVDTCQTFAVGIEKNQNNNTRGLRISPNPAQSYLTVSLEVNAVVNYEITDCVGRYVHQGQIKGTEDLDLAGFSPGIYFLKIKDHTTASSVKFIKIE